MFLLATCKSIKNCGWLMQYKINSCLNLVKTKVDSIFGKDINSSPTHYILSIKAID